MRVAVRRARVAARLFGGYFRDKSVHRYVNGLRRTGRLLGAVRDLDVALARAKQTAGRNKERPTQVLLDEWARRRNEAHANLVEWLDSEEYKSFYAAFLIFCATPERNAIKPSYLAGTSPMPLHVRTVFPTMLVERFARIRTYEFLFAQSDANDNQDYATLHALRIDCKYLRYTLEFALHLLGPNGEALIGKLKQLQDDLGDLNDAVVSRGLIEHSLYAAAHSERYAQAQETLIRELSSAVPGLLREFTGPETRRQLGAAIAVF
jgi:CHAD domain-containing protein